MLEIEWPEVERFYTREGSCVDTVRWSHPLVDGVIESVTLSCEESVVG